MLLNYITWNIDPVLFSIGNIHVRWYGLMWALGFLFGYFVMRRIYRREKMPDDSMDKLLIYMLIFTVVGARLGHCLFYEPEYYLSHPLKMLAVWEGGLASHGGAIGILLGLWIYMRVYNKSNKKAKDAPERISYIWILDRVVVPVCLVGALIRIGNVTNHEIYGTPTSLPWGFVFMRGLSTTTRLARQATAVRPASGCHVTRQASMRLSSALWQWASFCGCTTSATLVTVSLV